MVDRLEVQESGSIHMNLANHARLVVAEEERDRWRRRARYALDLLRRYEEGRAEGLPENDDHWSDLDRDVNRVLLRGRE